MTMPSTQQELPPVPDVRADERERARSRLHAKRKFYSDVVAYLVINGILVVVWAIGGHGSFWPGWVMAIWGALLLLDAYRVYLRRPVTEADVEEELRRHR